VKYSDAMKNAGNIFEIYVGNIP